MRVAGSTPAMIRRFRPLRSIPNQRAASITLIG